MMNEKMLVRFDHYHDEWAVQYKDVVSRMISFAEKSAPSWSRAYLIVLMW